MTAATPPAAAHAASSPSLRLLVQTPAGVVFDEPVDALRAEDEDGWFGVLPGRSDVVAILPPGLVLLQQGARERVVVVDAGLLSLEDGIAWVLTQEAVLAESLAEVPLALAAARERQARMGHLQRDILGDLAREALRRLAAGERA